MLMFWKCCHFIWFMSLLHNLIILYDDYLIVSISQFFQHFNGMLSYLGRRAPNLGRDLGNFHRETWHLHFAGRLWRFQKHFLVEHLWIGKCFFEVVDGAAWHTFLIKNFYPLFSGTGKDSITHNFIDVGPVNSSFFIGVETGIRYEVFEIQDFTEA